MRRVLIAARNRAVGVEAGRIVATEGRFDAVLRFPDGELRPGLVNAHDHLHRNHFGRLGRPPYRNAYHWAEDIQRRDRARIAQGRLTPRRQALLMGADKNLRAGVTTLVHHDRWERDFEGGFPIRVAPVASADSLGMTEALPERRAGEPFALHVAEGIDAAAADEVRALDRAGCLTRDLIAVHCVGADPDGVARLRASGAAVAWCPSSNLFLFDRTAPRDLLAPGIDLLIGSDSLLTGAGDLLDELRCARRLGLIDDRRLEAAVGGVAARRLGLPEPSLSPGARADLVVLAKPLLEATAGDVELVLVGGAPRVASPVVAESAQHLFAKGRIVRRGGVDRWIATPEPAGRPIVHSQGAESCVHLV